MQDGVYVFEIKIKSGTRTTIMKFLKYVLLILVLLSGYAQAFTPLTVNFDGGGSGWSTSGTMGTSTFTIITDGSGKHLQAKAVRDVNDGTGRYTKALGSTLNISDVGDSIYLEADIQVVDGFNNFGSIFLGLGKGGNSFQNQILVRLYWDGTTGADRYSFYGAIYDSNAVSPAYSKVPLSVTGGNQVGMAGLPYRIKAQFSNKKDIDDVNRLSYQVDVYRINEDGSTGSLVGDTNATQGQGDVASLEVNQVGIFITNQATAQQTAISVSRFLTANIDNLRVSDAGFGAGSVLPSWYNFTTSDTDIYETFGSNPSGTWTTYVDNPNEASFTWVSRASDGYMDVVLTRYDPNYTARFYLPLDKEYYIHNSYGATEYYGIYYFVEFDVYIVDMDGFAEGLIGTGSTGQEVTREYPYEGPNNYMNILAGAFYGAQELGNGIRANLVGYGNTWPTTRRAATVVGLLRPGNTYRMKITAAQRYDSGASPVGTRTRMIGSVYTINPDGTDGEHLATLGEWNSTAGDDLYANIMGIFSSMQTTTTPRTMRMYVDNMHFSDVGFKLDGVMPTWFNVIPCDDLPPQISGDAGGPAGKGSYDCAVDVYDLMYLAEDWLKIGN
jgi:hypothetical protein